MPALTSSSASLLVQNFAAYFSRAINWREERRSSLRIDARFVFEMHRYIRISDFSGLSRDCLVSLDLLSFYCVLDPLLLDKILFYNKKVGEGVWSSIAIQEREREKVKFRWNRRNEQDFKLRKSWRSREVLRWIRGCLSRHEKRGKEK